MRKKKQRTRSSGNGAAVDFSTLRRLTVEYWRLRQLLVSQKKSGGVGLNSPQNSADVDKLSAVSAELYNAIQQMAPIYGMHEVQCHMAAATRDLQSAEVPLSVFSGEAINPYQMALLEVYPGRNDLNFDPRNPMAAAQSVFMDDTGDSLFTFLWRTLAHRDPKNVTGVIKAMDLALSDLQAVKTGLIQRFAGRGQHGAGTVPLK